MTNRRFLDVDTWNEHLANTGERLHVYIDGQDVTRRCYRAVFHTDGIHGDAWCYKLNEDGHVYIDPSDGYRDPVEETLTGAMIFKPGGPV